MLRSSPLSFWICRVRLRGRRYPCSAYIIVEIDAPRFLSQEGEDIKGLLYRWCGCLYTLVCVCVVCIGMCALVAHLLQYSADAGRIPFTKSSASQTRIDGNSDAWKV